MTDEQLAAWARNWHWQDTAHDKPVDPSIYFRDMRMLRAFIAHQAEEKRKNCKHFGRIGSGSIGSDGSSSTHWYCPDCGASYSQVTPPKSQTIG
jgi:hypothetical protein